MTWTFSFYEGPASVSVHLFPVVQSEGFTPHRIIHHHLAQREKKNNVNFQAPKESLEAAKDFQALLKFDEWAAPTPEAMEAFISQRNLMTPELQDWVNDYKHFIARGEIRRVDKFAAE